MKIDWDYIQKHWDWLGHIVEALIMSVIVAALFMIAFPMKTALPSGQGTFTVGKSATIKRA